MTNKFGIEIEFHGFGGCTDDAKHHLNDKIDSLSFKDYDDYSYSFDQDWYVKTDCSVSRGIEIASPPLQFTEQNLKSVEAVVEAIKPVGSVSDQCGIHVHVDATFLRDFSATKRRDFFKFLNQSFCNVEDKFDKLVKESRRDGQRDQYERTILNNFCKSNKNSIFEQVERNRYHKMNIYSYNEHKTVEFRQFHGTFNSKAILAWITLCVTFMGNARKHFELAYQA